MIDSERNAMLFLDGLKLVDGFLLIFDFLLKLVHVDERSVKHFILEVDGVLEGIAFFGEGMKLVPSVFQVGRLLVVSL